MTIKEQLESDLKTAMLAGDKTLTSTLRGLKSAILYAEVASGQRDEGLENQQVLDLFAKEAKKRQESADLFEQGGNLEKAADERREKEVIARYLPSQLSDDELETILLEVIGDAPITKADMGKTIGAVKAKVGSSVDGSRIAQAVRARIVSE